MAKKNGFTGIGADVADAISNATTETAPEEKSIAQGLPKGLPRTEGKLPRINMAFLPENYKYLCVIAALNGMTLGAYINYLIEKDRTAHAAQYEKAQQLQREIMNETQGGANGEE